MGDSGSGGLPKFAPIRRLKQAILGTPGDTRESIRSAVAARAQATTGDHVEDDGGEVPAELRPFVDKVTLHAYKVTDDDIQALRERGYSDEAILEVALSASVGAAMARLELGLRALRGGGS